MNARTSNRILIGIVLGILLAFVGVSLFGVEMTRFSWLGTLFLNALKMLIVPLVVASMVVGITGLGDVRSLGRMGGITVIYYTVTTGLAVLMGMILVNWIQPGAGLKLGTEVPATVLGKENLGVSDLLLSFVSDNIVASMAKLDLLPIIVFSIFFAAVLTTLGEKGKPAIAVFESLNEAVMKMVEVVMYLAPLGVFGLVAGRFGAASGEPGGVAAMVGSVGKYTLTVLLGLGLHAFVVLPLILWLVGGRNPLRYAMDLATPLLAAFSTASSSATLPLTLEAVEERAGVPRRSAYFVLPLGATINMDGTALYEAVAAIFIAQAAGIHLSLMQQILIFVTATLAAIGAAGIPQAGLVTMVIVLRAVGLPLEGIALLLSIDWLLDRFRTTVNVWGDACGAAVVAKRVEASPPASGLLG